MFYLAKPPPPIIYYNTEWEGELTKSNPPPREELMVYTDTRKFVGDTCETGNLAWSAVVSLPKNISASQRQEVLEWLAKYQPEQDNRPRLKPRKRP